MQTVSEEIIRRATEGDLKSFEVIYRATADFVYNVALRVVNNRQDAEEVTQEVFLNIHRKLDQFRFESSFKTWVYRITVNNAINFAKKSSRPSHKTVELDENQVADAKPVTRKLDEEYQKEMIDKLLSEISLDQRTCVILRNIEGLSYQEIADTLNININTVRTRLKRAREKLLSLKKQVECGRL